MGQLSAIGDRMGEVMDSRQELLNTKEGETLSIDDIQDIYIQVMGEHRAKTNMSLTTKTKTGEINDYLEVRRPFGAAQWFPYLNFDIHKSKYSVLSNSHLTSSDLPLQLHYQWIVWSVAASCQQVIFLLYQSVDLWCHAQSSVGHVFLGWRLLLPCIGINEDVVLTHERILSTWGHCRLLLGQLVEWIVSARPLGVHALGAIVNCLSWSFGIGCLPQLGLQGCKLEFEWSELSPFFILSLLVSQGGLQIFQLLSLLWKRCSLFLVNRLFQRDHILFKKFKFLLELLFLFIRLSQFAV